MIHKLGEAAEIASNSADPPDLLVSTPMNCIGVELCELIYRDRYPRDSALGRVEQAIRSLISADDYRPYHLQFTLKQTSEGRIPLPNRGRLLAALQELTDLMARGKDLASARGTTWVLLEEHLPEPCRTFLHMVALNNIGDGLPPSSVMPVITFANSAQEISKKALRGILQETIARKLDMRLTGTNVLLIWSSHPSFRHCISETCSIINDLLFSRIRSPFSDVIYLHRSTENILVIVMMNRVIRVRVSNRKRAKADKEPNAS